MNTLYKYSQFNIEVSRDENSIIIYNTYSCKKASVSITDYQRKSDKLLGYGFIVPVELDEIQRLKDEAHEQTNRTDFLYLSIALTMGCNMHCKYCFEDTKLCNTEYMTKETMNSVVKFIELKYKENNIKKPVHIKWFGGEPLLAINQIEYIVNRLNSINIEVSSKMYTNGLLLTKENALKLKALGLKEEVVIPLDGLAEYYAEHKGTTENSFYTVINNIRQCQDILNIRIQLNTTNKNKKDIIYLYNNLRSEFGIKCPLSLIPVMNYNSNCNEDYYIDLDTFQTIKDELKIKEAPRRCLVGCEAFSNAYYVISTKGDIYLCEHMLGKDQEPLANITNDISDIHKGTVWDIDYMIDSCSDCVLLPVCMNKCPTNQFIDKIQCNRELQISRLKHDLKEKTNTMQLNNIDWEVTPYCNHKCRYCFNYWREENSTEADISFNREHDSDYFLSIAKLIAEQTPRRVLITGGEPLSIFNKILPSIRYIKEKNINIYLNSNGTMLTDDIAEELHKLDAVLFISIPCGLEDICDNITGIRGSFKRIEKSIIIAKRHKVKLFTNMVVSKLNIDYITDTAKYIVEDMGLKYFCATKVTLPCYNSEELSKIALTHADTDKMLKHLLRIEQKYNIRVDSAWEYSLCTFDIQELAEKFGFKRKCNAGKTQICITPDGGVKPCSVSNEIYGNIFDETIENVYSKMECWRDGSLLPTVCKICKHLEYCGGGCRVDAENTYGTKQHIDSTAKYKNIPRNYR